MRIEDAKPEGLTIHCPSCNAQAVITQAVKEVQHFGRLLFSTLSCNACGFKMNDVQMIDTQEASKYSAEVRGLQDLSVKLVKSSTGTVRIPALNTTIEPGPASEGYLTNVEGLLERVEDATRVLKSSADSPQQKKKAQAILDKIAKARAGKLTFKVYVLDPHGNSALIGSNVIKSRLSKAEASELKDPLDIYSL